MTSIPTKRFFTVEEYLRQEEASLEKHEFHDGEIFAMAGGTYEHSAISSNVNGLLFAALDGTPCRPLESNLRVGILNSSKFVYPDVQVICSPPQFDPRDLKRQTILNPRVIIEVLSESTEAYDRGKKFAFYRDVDSIEEYILISQTEPLIEGFFRNDQREWAFSAVRGMEASFTFRTLKVSLPLKRIYKDIVFPPPEQDEPDPRTATG
jgi:Uma2 family endonuclease